MNVAFSPPHSENKGLTLTAINLSKRFNREWIFKNVSYSFLPGHTYAITGPNGSGKSTFLQVMWGQLPQSSGEIRFQRDVREIPPDEFFRNLSIATPYMDLIEEFTLAEMLDFHFKLKKMRPGHTLDDMLDLLYLRDAQQKQLVNFSSGMKQRVKLGLAFYSDADVFFLDEPATNLDTQAFDWYRRELGLLPQKSIVFIASNDPSEYPESATVLNLQDYKK